MSSAQAPSEMADKHLVDADSVSPDDIAYAHQT